MFHSRIGLLTVAATLFCLAVQPINSYASEAERPAVQVQSQPAHVAAKKKTALLKDVSLADIRRTTRTKISDTQKWVKDNTAIESAKSLMQDMERAADRLQDRVSPVGRIIKKSVKRNLPGKGMAERGDRTFSVYGLLLMMAFGLVFLFMSFAGPASRLGGRH